MTGGTATPGWAQFTLLTTITNPAPSFYPDQFGWSVAYIGPEHFIVGAPYKDTTLNNVGAAFLYHTNGTLLLTITNPAPLADDSFGWAVAPAGQDCLAVSAVLGSTGAGRVGAVYLYDLQGGLMTTLTNPSPVAYDYFGWSLAKVPNSRVLVGAYWDDTGATDCGAAYLFATNGTLLTTITNPTPAYQDDFGYAVSALGNDLVIIGARGDSKGAAHAGVVYLFTHDGVLSTTITNPTPVSFDYFGTAVAAAGPDRILVGAPSDNTGAEDAGAAYLFSLSGALLTTFTNPAPSYMDNFGSAVAAVGSDRVLIGAYRDDAGAQDCGIAYLFDHSGKLLNTITNPAPQPYDSFGNALAATADSLLVSAFSDSTGSPSAGTVSIYTQAAAPSAPALGISRSAANTVTIFWPSPSAGWILQQKTNLIDSGNWSDITTGILDDGVTKKLVVTPNSIPVFYRLKQP